MTERSWEEGPLVSRRSFVKAGVKRNRVERHLDADWSRELGSHAAHTLAGGSLALSRFALDDQNIAAAVRREVIGDAGADDSPSDDDDVRSLHRNIDRNDQAF